MLLADRWEPSSKRCSGCGWIDEDLTLSDQTFHCEACGLVLDRDLNAAINLGKLAGSLSDSLNACGEERSGTLRKKRVKRASQAGTRARRKQELGATCGLSTDG